MDERCGWRGLHGIQPRPIIDAGSRRACGTRKQPDRGPRIRRQVTAVRVTGLPRSVFVALARDQKEENSSGEKESKEVGSAK